MGVSDYIDHFKWVEKVDYSIKDIKSTGCQLRIKF